MYTRHHGRHYAYATASQIHPECKPTLKRHLPTKPEQTCTREVHTLIYKNLEALLAFLSMPSEFSLKLPLKLPSLLDPPPGVGMGNPSNLSPGAALPALLPLSSLNPFHPSNSLSSLNSFSLASLSSLSARLAAS